MTANALHSKWLSLGRLVVSAFQSSSLRECYDVTASNYHTVFGKNQETFSDAIVDLLRREHPGKYRRALDLGAGTGILTRRLQEICDSVYGVDFSHGMLKQALVENNASRGSRYVEGDIFVLPFSDKKFDLIVSLGVISHILPEHFSRFVSEMHRVSTDSAKVVIGVTPLPWRLFLARRSSFETTSVDRLLIHSYNLFQKGLGLEERRGWYHPEVFRETFRKCGYSVQNYVTDGLAIMTADKLSH